MGLGEVASLESERKEEGMGIDQVLEAHAGEFGRWQLKHFLITCLAWTLEAIHTMVMIFADRDPAWRCLAGPAGDPCRASIETVVGNCELPSGSWEWIGGIASSTVAEWGLVCGARYKVGLVQSSFFAGSMIGAGVFGHLSDSFMGRKGTLSLVCALNALFGLLTALSPSFWFYLVFRFLTGFSTGGVGLCAFVLATEPIGPSKRGIAGMSTFYFFSAGIAALTLTALLLPQWRALYLITSLPSILFLVAALPSISESPRWYLVRGRTAEAMNIMKAIAKTNGKTIPDGITLTLDGDNEKKGTLLDVILTPLTRLRLALVVFIAFFCAIIYYGLSLNVVNLKTSVYLSVFVNAVAEMPAYLITATLLEWLGRRPLSVGTMWVSGFFCLVGGIAAVEMKKLRLVCGVIGIFSVSATYNLIYIYTAELFPTTVRNAALGCATQASQLGAILSPMVVVLGERIPFLMFGFCGVAGGLLALLLPETMNKPLYDTLAGMEEGESSEWVGNTNEGSVVGISN
ncbi:organic cation/carnitine transporter 4-like [Wolffia australiana]